VAFLELISVRETSLQSAVSSHCRGSAGGSYDKLLLSTATSWRQQNSVRERLQLPSKQH